MANPRTRLFAYGLIFAGIIILTVGGGYYFLLNTGQKPNPELVPDNVGMLSLSNLTTGQEALNEINQLHGKAFPLTYGAVGRYGTDAQAIIWVAAATDDHKAAETLKSMRDRIAEGNSPFTPTGETINGNRTIYTLDGLGQKHFYFQSRNLIVWTAVDADLYENVLEQVLDFYP
jgi:hypothetical protein